MTSSAPPSPEQGRATGTAPLAWTRTASAPAAVLAGVLLAAAGLVLGRPDVALLGLPLLVTAALGGERPVAAPASVAVEVLPRAPGGDFAYEVRLEVPDEVLAAADCAVLRLVPAGGRSQDLVVRPRPDAPVRGRVRPLHSGPQEVLSATLWLVAADGGHVGGPVGPVAVDRVVAPAPVPLRRLPLPPDLRGLSGVHDSSRPGAGGEFHDLGPFRAGDRLRTIDWKATARRARFDGDLYVRRTTATADAAVLVAVDDRDDVGEVVTEWNLDRSSLKGLSSLDLAREAAASLAAATVRTGDRIAFQTLAGARRTVPLGAGARHLQRVLTAVAHTRASGEPALRHRAPLVPAGALVYVLSTYLDDEAPRTALGWRAVGHRVIALDVLPTGRLQDATREERLAHRIVVLERDDRLEALQAQGVEVVRWQDDAQDDARDGERANRGSGAARPTRDAQLRALTRGRRRP